MSVINQMLKDLEQRTPEQGQAAMPVPNQQKPSTVKIVLISFIVLAILNGIGFYIWSLQQQIASNQLSIKEQISNAVVKVNPDIPEKPVETVTLAQKTKTQQIITQKVLAVEKQPLPEVKGHSASELSQQPASQKLVSSVSSAQPEPTGPIYKSVTPVLAQAPTTSQMSVSRRKLTPQELVVQKLTRAEKAIKNNEVMKAEQLFEDVLIIEPNHKQARKKLAALWFGRKSYQQAINLLSQGISLDRSDAELRILKARIHLQQKQPKAAYTTLKPLASLKNQEYQVMLANVSQQIEHYKSAIQAYKTLINMQAYSGRWHLGLAIVYDKNSQFSLAVAEYALAVTKSDLSIASAKFAQQRMQALGE